MKMPNQASQGSSFSSDSNHLNSAAEIIPNNRRSMPIPMARTASKPIPLPPNKEHEEEVETEYNLMRMYNESTWKMYYRIQNARRKRKLTSSIRPYASD